MMKYEYVSIKLEKDDDHRRIINEYAEKGYKYVGYIPTKSSPYGKVKIVDLIFEKEE